PDRGAGAQAPPQCRGAPPLARLSGGIDASVERRSAPEIPGRFVYCNTQCCCASSRRDRSQPPKAAAAHPTGSQNSASATASPAGSTGDDGSKKFNLLL